MSNGTHSQQIVQKLWNYCNILRDDGLSYGDYVEQLTFLLFLKMAHEQTQPPYERASPIPAWSISAVIRASARRTASTGPSLSMSPIAIRKIASVSVPPRR